MKRIKYMLTLFCMGVLLCGCSEDYLTADVNNSVTEEQLDDLANTSPEALLKVIQPRVKGLYAWMTAFNSGGFKHHDDFGYMTIALASELWGQDMVQTGNRYDWFDDDYIYTNRGYTSQRAYYVWNYFYKLVKASNDIIGQIPPDVANKELRYSRGQALAMRAFAYHHLVQFYQHTYKGHENAPAVPLVFPEMSNKELANNPRASVTKIYSVIETDLLAAYDLLEGYATDEKTDMEQPLVAGLLARMYLCKEHWTNAAKYANMARQDFTMMTGEQYVDEKTGFNSINNSSWMWGADNTPLTEIVKTGIANFTSHIGSLSYGYCVAGSMYKAINKSLYDLIPATDVRKSAYLGGADQKMEVATRAALPPYSNIKFRPLNGIVGNRDNSADYVFMRVEEMYLIEAEALAMGGNLPGGKKLLTDMVKTRDPQFTSQAASAQELREEIWIQRRIEFWGEGLAWFDLKRLKKASLRDYKSTNHRADARFNLTEEHGLFLLRIPDDEIQTNQGIGEADNNPVATVS